MNILRESEGGETHPSSAAEVDPAIGTGKGIRRVKEGHCSGIGAAKYIPGPNHTNPGRNFSSELEQNYSLDEVARRLGLGAFL